MREPNPGRDAAGGPHHAGTTGGHRSAESPKPLRYRPVLPVWRGPPWGTKTTSSAPSALSSRRFRCRSMSPPRRRHRCRTRAPRRSAHPGCERDARQRRSPDFDGVPPPLPPGSSFRCRPLPTQTLNEHRSPRAGGAAGGTRGRGAPRRCGSGLIPALTSGSPGGSPLGGGPPRPPSPPAPAPSPFRRALKPRRD